MAIPKTSFARTVFRIVGNPGDLKDIDFRPSAIPPITVGAPATIAYNGVTVNQTFKEIVIHNLTSDSIYYSIDRDDLGLISVNSSFAWGVKTIASGTLLAENGSSVDRLRIKYVGTGTVEVILIA